MTKGRSSSTFPDIQEMNVPLDCSVECKYRSFLSYNVGNVYILIT